MSEAATLALGFALSTFLGGAGDDAANAAARDAQGNVIVAGETASGSFVGAPGALRGPSDAFVVKLDPTGSTVLWAVRLGGAGADTALALAVDAAGDVVVAGETSSADFPATAGALQQTHGGGADAFVARLSGGSGALLSATYLGGNGADRANALAIDAAGRPVISGRTSSTDLPVSPGAFQSGYRGGAFDAFAARLSAGLDQNVFTTYVGGAGNDAAFAVGVDAAGTVFLAGGTRSTDFPLTGTAYSSTPLDTDAFLARLSASGATLLYGTFLGGSQTDRANALVLEPSGTVLVAGQTASTDFPSLLPVQPAYGGGPNDGFLVRVDPAASGAGSVTFGSFLGGNGDDRIHALTRAADARTLLAGQTSSTNLAVRNAPQAGFAGGASDALFAVLGPALAVESLGPVGGGAEDAAHAALLSGASLAEPWLFGTTRSSAFPLAAPLQPIFGGGADAFALRLSSSAVAQVVPAIPDLADGIRALLAALVGASAVVLLRRG